MSRSKWIGIWSLMGIVMGGTVLLLLFISDTDESIATIILGSLIAIQGFFIQRAASQRAKSAHSIDKATHENSNRLKALHERIKEVESQNAQILTGVRQIRNGDSNGQQAS